MGMNNTNYSKSTILVRELVQVALFAALAYVSANFLQIPYGNGGVIQLGDSMIYIAAILFGSRTAALSGAIGLSMFDLFSPYAVWAPYTFVIKLVMGIIAGSIANSGNSKGNNWIKNIIGIALAGIWMAIGYYFAEAIMTKNMIAPLAYIPGSIIQVAGSGLIAVITLIALKKTKYFNK